MTAKTTSLFIENAADAEQTYGFTPILEEGIEIRRIQDGYYSFTGKFFGRFTEGCSRFLLMGGDHEEGVPPTYYHVESVRSYDNVADMDMIDPVLTLRKVARSLRPGYHEIYSRYDEERKIWV